MSELSLHDQLAAVYDEVSEEQEDTATPDTTTDEVQLELDLAPEPEAEPAEEAPETPETAEEQVAEPVDKSVDKSEVAEETPADDPEPVDKSEGNIHAAPGKWSPAAREEWAKIPEAARKEIKRAENRIEEMKRSEAPDKRFKEDFNQVIAPFAANLQAAGATNPLQAVQGLLRTEGTLRSGTPQEKASTIARMVQNYNINIEDLAHAIDGSGAPSQPEQQPQYAPQDVNAMVDQRFQAREQELLNNSVRTQINAFENNPANEFFNDVRHDVALVLDAAAKQGKVITMQQAYDKACLMSDSVSSALATRTATANRGKNNEEAARLARASTSISGSPTGSSASTAPPTSIAGILDSAWDEQTTR